MAGKTHPGDATHAGLLARQIPLLHARYESVLHIEVHVSANKPTSEVANATTIEATTNRARPRPIHGLAQ